MQDAAMQSRLLRLVRMTRRLARKDLAPYACRVSRHDFTQPQLLSCLVLKQATKNTYRGVCELLTLASALREAIGLRKVPHWTTLQKFAAKPEIPDRVDRVLARILKETGLDRIPTEIAVDSTGLQTGVASLHYRTKRWRNGGQARQSVKLSTAVVCGLLIPAAVCVEIGASPDMRQMPTLMEQIEARTTPTRLMADAGYDAEWVHERCRERWGAESLIPPVPRTRDGSIRTRWRSRMRPLPKAYGRRWQAESYFSGLKRTTGATLSSRTPRTLVAETWLKVLAYAVHR